MGRGRGHEQAEKAEKVEKVGPVGRGAGIRRIAWTGVAVTVMALGGLVVGPESGAAATAPAAPAQAAVGGAEAGGSPGPGPEPWLPQDPADSLYRDAREALNGGRYDRAASLFAQIREQYPRSGYVADSYYFQALALQRAGGSRRLTSALALLETQGDRHPDAASAGDARALRVRLEGILAREGSAPAAARVARAAQAGCEDADQDMRSAALGALLQMDADRAIPILEQVLESRDACSAELRKRAVFLVSQKMGDRTVEILLDLAHRNPDPDPEVREAAVFWLSQVRSDEVVDALGSILEEADEPALQEKALFALSQHRSEGAARALQRYAERGDVDRELRERAIFWIGQNDRAGGGEYLRSLWGSLGDDEELKEKVIFGVAQSPSPEDRAWLLARVRDTGEAVEIRKNALFWAGQSGAVPVADLQGLYRSVNDPEMKEQVIFVLSQRGGDAEAVDALMEIARDEDDPELRENAVFWLGQSRDPRVGEFLLDLIRGG